MMNIMQVQAALRDLDDNALKQEMLSPGMAPQFLVLSEMQRRQEIRNGGRPSQVPQSTMKDEALQGLGGLPQAPQAPPQAPPAPPQQQAPMPQAPLQAPPQGPPQGFAGGGAVRGLGDLSDDELETYWRSYQPNRMPAGPGAYLGLMSPTQRAARPMAPGSSPWSLEDVNLERARRMPRAGLSGPIDSNQQFAGTGEYAPYAAPVAAAGAYDTPDSLGSGPVPGAVAPAAVPGAAPSAGLPALRPQSGLGPSSLPMYPATRTASLIESGLGANTNHGGSFRGVLGIGDGMWKDYADRLGLKAADRESPEAQRRIYETFSEDQRKLNPKATDSDVYTAWAAGPGAAGAFRRDPKGDAFATYSGVTNPKMAETAFRTNPGLLERGRTNEQVLAAYKGRWDRAAGPGGQPGPAFGGEDVAGAPIRVEAPGSGAAAVTGDSTSPAAVVDRGGDGTDFESYRARTRGADRFGGFDEEAKRLFGDRAERTKDAGNFALMEAGLKIMGSQSPRLAGAVSEGGLAGLGSYRQGLEEARKGEREGFSARLGIAGARAGQDQSNDRLAATVYGTDRQADTTLRAAQLQADNAKGIATLQAGTQRDVAAGNNRTQLEVAERNPTLQVLRAAATDPAIRDIYLKAQQDPARSEYYLQQAQDVQRRGYLEAYNKLRDDTYGKPGGLPLLPAEQTKADAKFKVEAQKLERLFPTLFPPGAGGAAPAATADNPLALPGR